MIQYPKNTHVTLPCSEGALGTTRILRDPPRSIHNRHIVKVGDTSEIRDRIDSAETGDRMCEYINKYARGINPMVSVSYSNYGTNGGQMRDTAGMVGTDQLSLSTGQAYLPYRVNRDGAFRPPVLSQEELLPLSRQPRPNTSATTNPGTSAVKLDPLPDIPLNSVRNKLLRVCADAGKTKVVQSGAAPITSAKYFVTDVKRGQIETNLTGLAKLPVYTQAPRRAVKSNCTYAQVNTNPQLPGGKPVRSNDRLPVLHNRLYVSANTNPMGGDRSMTTRPTVQTTQNRPHTSATTNKSGIGDRNQEIGAREFSRLAPRTALGSFENGKCIPTFNYIMAPPSQK